MQSRWLSLQGAICVNYLQFLEIASNKLNAFYQSKLPHKGTPRVRRNGVIGHISKRENGNWMKKMRYCVIYQSGIQRDWVNLA